MSNHLRLYAWLVAIASVAAIAGAVLAMLVAWVSQPGPPVTVAEGHTLTPSVKAGGEVVMSFTLVRSRACPAVIYGFLIGGDGRAVKRYEPELGGYSAAGTADVVVVRNVPEGISGPVCYRHTRIDSCETRSYVTAGPDVCFEAIP
jgi:hypothetical protein